MTDVTQALSAVNLAGPRAREIMGALTDLDCSSEAFTYLDGKQAEVAGVPCLILRIGFVGEVGYEIHCPSVHGEHLWDALMEAGAQHGLKPFGLEPQRLLRLQKLHILIGQDTDSESTPFGAAMPWIVKLDKEEDFIGKWALERAAGAELETALVGIKLRRRARADRGRRRAARRRRRRPRRPGHERALLAAARRRDRDGVGARGAREGRVARDDLGRGHAASRPRWSRRRSTTPTARSCAREPRVPLARRDRAGAQLDGARRAGRRRPARAARRLERRGRLRWRGRRARTARRERRLRGPLAPRQAGAARRARAAARRGHSPRRRLVVPDVGGARARALRAGRHRAPARAARRRRRRPHLRHGRDDDRRPAGARAAGALQRARPARQGHAGARLPARARWRARPARCCARPRTAG